MWAGAAPDSGPSEFVLRRTPEQSRAGLQFPSILSPSGRTFKGLLQG